MVEHFFKKANVEKQIFKYANTTSKILFWVACLIVAQRVSLFYCSSSMQSESKKKQGQMAKLRRVFLDVC